MAVPPACECKKGHKPKVYKHIPASIITRCVPEAMPEDWAREIAERGGLPNGRAEVQP